MSRGSWPPGYEESVTLEKSWVGKGRRRIAQFGLRNPQLAKVTPEVQSSCQQGWHKGLLGSRGLKRHKAQMIRTFLWELGGSGSIFVPGWPSLCFTPQSFFKGIFRRERVWVYLRLWNICLNILISWIFTFLREAICGMWVPKPKRPGFNHQTLKYSHCK